MRDDRVEVAAQFARQRGGCRGTVRLRNRIARLRRAQARRFGCNVEDPLFDAIVMPFGVQSGWRDRNLVRTALARQMAVMAHDSCPAQLTAQVKEDAKQARGGWFKKAEPLAASGSHAFLQQTYGWTAEQICIAHVLTEPAITTVQMPVKNLDHLETLAAAPERNLPAQIAAQIEMAHFAEERTARTRSSDKRRA